MTTSPLLGRAAALALLLHQGLEPCGVDGDPPLGGDDLRQVEEAVGVVELEDDGAAEEPAAEASSKRRRPCSSVLPKLSSSNCWHDGSLSFTGA